MAKYLDNKEFKNEIIVCQQNEEVSEQLHMMFYLIAKNLAKSSSFRNYTFIDDMISEAYLRCVKMFTKFNIEKSNPFAYFTTVCFRVFLVNIKKEQKQQDIKWKSLKLEMDECIALGLTPKINSNIKEKLEKVV